MKTANILEAQGMKSIPVWIAGSDTKFGGRKDIREFPAKATDVGCRRIFIFDNTYRDFDRTSFSIGEGCEIRDDTGHYRCIDSEPLHVKNKVLPLLITERIQ